MKLVRSLGIATTAVLLAAFTVTLVPSGAAQYAESDVNFMTIQDALLGSLGKEGRLSPDTEKAEMTFKLKIRIPGGTACVGKSYTVKYTQQNPNLAPHASVSISPLSETVNYQGGGQGSTPYTGTNEPKDLDLGLVRVTITFKQTAPAFQTQQIQVQAELESGTYSTTSGCNAKPTTAKPTFTATIQADFLPIVQFVPKEIIQKAGQNAKVVFPIDVTNLSNGDAKVDADFEGGGGLAAVTPPPGGLIVESKATRGDKAQNKVETRFNVLTATKNGYTNKVYPFTAKFTYTSATPAEVPTTEVSVPLSVKVQGVYVPGFDGPSLIASLGVALLGLGVVRRKA